MLLLAIITAMLFRVLIVVLVLLLVLYLVNSLFPIDITTRRIASAIILLVFLIWLAEYFGKR